ncbi:MAG: hypothetical protein JWO67_4564 [Streptosporangiaceae bacterium]|nr:hypothetical protein [Streptosporangiaceae bacterium]
MSNDHPSHPDDPIETNAEDVTGWLTRLEETHAAATKGPWRQLVGNGVVASRADDAEIVATWVERSADAAAIVAAHNAMPQLVAALRGVLALADELDRFGTARDRDNEDDDEAQAASAAAYLRSAHLLRSTVAAALTASPE